MTIRILLVLLLIGVSTLRVESYEPRTHRRLSRRAIDQSVLADPSGPLHYLGLRPLAEDEIFQIDVSPRIRDEGTLRQHVTDGAVAEDVVFLLVPTNHFFDPYNDRALEFANCNVAPWVCKRSPGWALETMVTHSNQRFSLRDARERLREALTLETLDERERIGKCRAPVRGRTVMNGPVRRWRTKTMVMAPSRI